MMTLWEKFREKGLSLPPIERRGLLYEAYQLGKRETYFGQAEQNIALIKAIESNPSIFEKFVQGLKDPKIDLERTLGLITPKVEQPPTPTLPPTPKVEVPRLPETAKVMPLPTVAAPKPIPPSPETIKYEPIKYKEEKIPTDIQQIRVTPGQTLSEISRKYQISIPDLLKLNPEIKDPNLIRAGQIIRLTPEKLPTVERLIKPPPEPVIKPPTLEAKISQVIKTEFPNIDSSSLKTISQTAAQQVTKGPFNLGKLVDSVLETLVNPFRPKWYVEKMRNIGKALSESVIQPAVKLIREKEVIPKVKKVLEIMIKQSPSPSSLDSLPSHLALPLQTAENIQKSPLAQVIVKPLEKYIPSREVIEAEERKKQLVDQYRIYETIQPGRGKIWIEDEANRGNVLAKLTVEEAEKKGEIKEIPKFSLPVLEARLNEVSSELKRIYGRLETLLKQPGLEELFRGFRDPQTGLTNLAILEKGQTQPVGRVIDELKGKLTEISKHLPKTPQATVIDEAIKRANENQRLIPRIKDFYSNVIDELYKIHADPEYGKRYPSAQIKALSYFPKKEDFLPIPLNPEERKKVEEATEIVKRLLTPERRKLLEAWEKLPVVDVETRAKWEENIKRTDPDFEKLIINLGYLQNTNEAKQVRFFNLLKDSNYRASLLSFLPQIKPELQMSVKDLIKIAENASWIESKLPEIVKLEEELIKDKKDYNRVLSEALALETKLSNIYSKLGDPSDTNSLIFLLTKLNKLEMEQIALENTIKDLREHQKLSLLTMPWKDAIEEGKFWKKLVSKTQSYLGESLKVIYTFPFFGISKLDLPPFLGALRKEGLPKNVGEFVEYWKILNPRIEPISLKTAYESVLVPFIKNISDPLARSIYTQVNVIKDNLLFFGLPPSVAQEGFNWELVKNITLETADEYFQKFPGSKEIYDRLPRQGKQLMLDDLNFWRKFVYLTGLPADPKKQEILRKEFHERFSTKTLNEYAGEFYTEKGIRSTLWQPGTVVPFGKVEAENLYYRPTQYTRVVVHDLGLKLKDLIPKAFEHKLRNTAIINGWIPDTEPLETFINRDLKIGQEVFIPSYIPLEETTPLEIMSPEARVTVPKGLQTATMFLGWATRVEDFAFIAVAPQVGKFFKDVPKYLKSIKPVTKAEKPGRLASWLTKAADFYEDWYNFITMKPVTSDGIIHRYFPSFEKWREKMFGRIIVNNITSEFQEKAFKYSELGNIFNLMDSVDVDWNFAIKSLDEALVSPKNLDKFIDPIIKKKLLGLAEEGKKITPQLVNEITEETRKIVSKNLKSVDHYRLIIDTDAMSALSKTRPDVIDDLRTIAVPLRYPVTKVPELKDLPIIRFQDYDYQILSAYSYQGKKYFVTSENGHRSFEKMLETGFQKSDLEKAFEFFENNRNRIWLESFSLTPYQTSIFKQVYPDSYRYLKETMKLGKVSLSQYQKDLIIKGIIDWYHSGYIGSDRVFEAMNKLGLPLTKTMKELSDNPLASYEIFKEALTNLASGRVQDYWSDRVFLEALDNLKPVERMMFNELYEAAAKPVGAKEAIKKVIDEWTTLVRKKHLRGGVKLPEHRITQKNVDRVSKVWKQLLRRQAEWDRIYEKAEIKVVFPGKFRPVIDNNFNQHHRGVYIDFLNDQVVFNTKNFEYLDPKTGVKKISTYWHDYQIWGVSNELFNQTSQRIIKILNSEKDFPVITLRWKRPITKFERELRKIGNAFHDFNLDADEILIRRFGLDSLPEPMQKSFLEKRKLLIEKAKKEMPVKLNEFKAEFLKRNQRLPTEQEIQSWIQTYQWWKVTSDDLTKLKNLRNSKVVFNVETTSTRTLSEVIETYLKGEKAAWQAIHKPRVYLKKLEPELKLPNSLMDLATQIVGPDQEKTKILNNLVSFPDGLVVPGINIPSPKALANFLYPSTQVVKWIDNRKFTYILQKEIARRLWQNYDPDSFNKYIILLERKFRESPRKMTFEELFEYVLYSQADKDILAFRERLDSILKPLVDSMMLATDHNLERLRKALYRLSTQIKDNAEKALGLSKGTLDVEINFASFENFLDGVSKNKFLKNFQPFIENPYWLNESDLIRKRYPMKIPMVPVDRRPVFKKVIDYQLEKIQKMIENKDWIALKKAVKKDLPKAIADVDQQVMIFKTPKNFEEIRPVITKLAESKENLKITVYDFPRGTGTDLVNQINSTVGREIAVIRDKPVLKIINITEDNVVLTNHPLAGQPLQAKTLKTNRQMPAKYNLSKKDTTFIDLSEQGLKKSITSTYPLGKVGDVFVWPNRPTKYMIVGHHQLTKTDLRDPSFLKLLSSTEQWNQSFILKNKNLYKEGSWITFYEILGGKSVTRYPSRIKRIVLEKSGLVEVDDFIEYLKDLPLWPLFERFGLKDDQLAKILLTEPNRKFLIKTFLSSRTTTGRSLAYSLLRTTEETGPQRIKGKLVELVTDDYFGYISDSIKDIKNHLLSYCDAQNATVVRLFDPKVGKKKSFVLLQPKDTRLGFTDDLGIYRLGAYIDSKKYPRIGELPDFFTEYQKMEEMMRKTQAFDPDAWTHFRALEKKAKEAYLSGRFTNEQEFFRYFKNAWGPTAEMLSPEEITTIRSQIDNLLLKKAKTEKRIADLLKQTPDFESRFGFKFGSPQHLAALKIDSSDVGLTRRQIRSLNRELGVKEELYRRYVEKEMIKTEFVPELASMPTAEFHEILVGGRIDLGHLAKMDQTIDRENLVLKKLIAERTKLKKYPKKLYILQEKEEGILPEADLLGIKEYQKALQEQSYRLTFLETAEKNLVETLWLGDPRDSLKIAKLINEYRYDRLLISDNIEKLKKEWTKRFLKEQENYLTSLEASLRAKWKTPTGPLPKEAQKIYQEAIETWKQDLEKAFGYIKVSKTDLTRSLNKAIQMQEDTVLSLELIRTFSPLYDYGNRIGIWRSYDHFLSDWWKLITGFYDQPNIKVKNPFLEVFSAAHREKNRLLSQGKPLPKNYDFLIPETFDNIVDNLEPSDLNTLQKFIDQIQPEDLVNRLPTIDSYPLLVKSRFDLDHFSKIYTDLNYTIKIGVDLDFPLPSGWLSVKSKDFLPPKTKYYLNQEFDFFNNLKNRFFTEPKARIVFVGNQADQIKERLLTDFLHPIEKSLLNDIEDIKKFTFIKGEPGIRAPGELMPRLPPRTLSENFKNLLQTKLDEKLANEVIQAMEKISRPLEPEKWRVAKAAKRIDIEIARLEKALIGDPRARFLALSAYRKSLHPTAKEILISLESPRVLTRTINDIRALADAGFTIYILPQKTNVEKIVVQQLKTEGIKFKILKKENVQRGLFVYNDIPPISENRIKLFQTLEELNKTKPFIKPPSEHFYALLNKTKEAFKEFQKLPSWFYPELIRLYQLDVDYEEWLKHIVLLSRKSNLLKAWKETREALTKTALLEAEIPIRQELKIKRGPLPPEAVAYLDNLKKNIDYQADLLERVVLGFYDPAKRRIPTVTTYLENLKTKLLEKIGMNVSSEYPNLITSFFPKGPAIYLKIIDFVEKYPYKLFRNLRNLWIKAVLTLRPAWALYNMLDDNVRLFFATGDINAFLRSHVLWVEFTKEYLRQAGRDAVDFAVALLGPKVWRSNKISALQELLAKGKIKYLLPNENEAVHALRKAWKVERRRIVREITKPALYNPQKFVFLRRKGITELYDQIIDKSRLQKLYNLKKWQLEIPELTPERVARAIAGGFYGSDPATKIKFIDTLDQVGYLNLLKRRLAIFEANLNLYHNVAENLRRLLCFESLLSNRALSIAEATLKTKLYLYDYRALDWASQALRSFFPFFTFARKSLELYLRLLARYGPMFYFSGRALIEAWNEAVKDLPEIYKQRVRIPGTKWYIRPNYSILDFLRLITDPVKAVTEIAEDPNRLPLGLVWDPVISKLIEEATGRRFFETSISEMRRRGWSESEIQTELEKNKIKTKNPLKDFYYFLSSFIPQTAILPLFVGKLIDIDRAFIDREIPLLNARHFRRFLSFMGLNIVYIDELAILQNLYFNTPPRRRFYFEQIVKRDDPENWRRLQELFFTYKILRVLESKSPKEGSQATMELIEVGILHTFYKLEEYRKGEGYRWLERKAKEGDLRPKEVLEKHWKKYETQNWYQEIQAERQLQQVENAVRKWLREEVPFKVSREQIAKMGILGIDSPIITEFSREDDILPLFFDQYGQLRVNSFEEAIKLSEIVNKKYGIRILGETHLLNAERESLDYRLLAYNAKEKKKIQDLIYNTKLSVAFAILGKDIDKVSKEVQGQRWEKFNNYINNRLTPEEKLRFYSSRPVYLQELAKYEERYRNIWQDIFKRFDDEGFRFYGYFFNQTPKWFQELSFVNQPNRRDYYLLRFELEKALLEDQILKEKGLKAKNYEILLYKSLEFPTESQARAWAFWEKEKPGIKKYFLEFRSLIKKTQENYKKYGHGHYYSEFYRMPKEFQKFHFERILGKRPTNESRKEMARLIDWYEFNFNLEKARTKDQENLKKGIITFEEEKLWLKRPDLHAWYENRNPLNKGYTSFTKKRFEFFKKRIDKDFYLWIVEDLTEEERMYYYRQNPNSIHYVPNLLAPYARLRKKDQEIYRETGHESRLADEFFWSEKNLKYRLMLEEARPGELAYRKAIRDLIYQSDDALSFYENFEKLPKEIKELYFRKNPLKIFYHYALKTYYTLVEEDQRKAELGIKSNSAREYARTPEFLRALDYYDLDKPGSKEYFLTWLRIFDETERRGRKYFYEIFFEEARKNPKFEKQVYERNPRRKIIYEFQRNLAQLKEPQRTKYFWDHRQTLARTILEKERPGTLGYFSFWKKLSALASLGRWDEYFNYYYHPDNEKHRQRHWRSDPRNKRRFELFREYQLMPSYTWEQRLTKREFLKRNPELLEWWKEDITPEEALLRQKIEKYYEILDQTPPDGQGRDYYTLYRKNRALANAYLQEEPEVLIHFQKNPRKYYGLPTSLQYKLDEYKTILFDWQKSEYLKRNPEIEEYFRAQYPPGIRKALEKRSTYFRLKPEERNQYLEENPDLKDFLEIDLLPDSYFVDPARFLPYQKAVEEVEDYFKEWLTANWSGLEVKRRNLPKIYLRPEENEEGRWFRKRVYQLAMATWVKLYEAKENIRAIMFFREIPDWLRAIYYEKHPEKRYISKYPLGRFLDEALRINDAKSPKRAWALKQLSIYGRNLPRAIYREVREILVREGIWENRLAWTKEQWNEYWRRRVIEENQLKEKDYQRNALLRTEIDKVLKTYPRIVNPLHWKKPLLGSPYPIYQ